MAAKTVTEHITWHNEPVVGEIVRVTTEGSSGSRTWTGDIVGTYEGVRPSEWTGEPTHYFRNATVNGTVQGLFGLPANEVR